MIRYNRRAVAALRALKKKELVVGFTDPEVAQYATFNEFGTADIPERPFFRESLRKNRTKYGKALGRALQRDLAADRALGLIGAEAAADLQESITTLRTPPNAPSTVAQKGSSNPLIDTGRMRQSVTFDVRDKE